MAFFRRTKPKIDSPAPNGQTPPAGTVESNGTNGGLPPWSAVAAPLNTLFLDLATVVNAPELEGLAKALNDVPKPNGPELSQNEAEQWVKLLTKKGERYIANARQYLAEKDGELKEVIRVLSKTIAEMSSEESLFAQSILDTTNRLTTISQLEDIRAIRQSITDEVGIIKESVQKQEQSRTQRMAALSTRVNVLQVELEEVSQESLRDSLTGLHNRRAFDQELRGLLDRNRTLPTPFVVVMFDIDDFKRINDRLGHPVGDKALQTVAMVSQKNLRSSDFMARYGGDEFVILLQADSLKKGKKKIDNLAAALSQITIPVDFEGKNVQLALTFSFGIAQYLEGDTG
jgi:diguanylate cyclase